MRITLGFWDHFFNLLRIMLVGLVVWGMVGCGGNAPVENKSELNSSDMEQVKSAIEEVKKTQLALVESQRIAEQAQQEVRDTQKLVETAQEDANRQRQFASFLKGFCISLAVIALIVGTALGSKARRDSKVRRR